MDAAAGERDDWPAPLGARELLGSLVRPLYLPSALYSVGVGAAIPAQVLVGLHVGLDAPMVALLIAVSGAVMVAGTWVAGDVVEAVGERRALVLATTAGVLPVLLLGAILALHLPGAVAAYALVLAAFNLSDGVWGVARQELMAIWVPAHLRGRAVSTYGASQRAARLVGPFVAGGLILAVGPIGGFVVFALGSISGLVALLSAPAPRRVDAGHRSVERAPGGPSPEPTATRGPAAVRRAFWVVGVGILALGIVRIQQEVLLPLWSAEAMGMSAALVSVAMGVSLALEMVLFYPAGIVLDRWGSLPVVCACLLGLASGFALLLVPGAFWPALVLIGLGGGIGSGIVKTIGLELAPEVGRPRFLGRWMALTSAGVILAPLLVATLGGVSLAAAALATAGIGFLGAGWLALAGRRHLRRAA